MRISDWSSDVCSADLSGVLRIAAAGIEQQAAAVGKDELGLSGQRLDILARLKADADSGAVKKGLAEESGEGDGAAIIGRAAKCPAGRTEKGAIRSEEHTSELQSLMRISYAVFCLKKKTKAKLNVHTIIIIIF